MCMWAGGRAPLILFLISDACRSVCRLTANLVMCFDFVYVCVSGAISNWCKAHLGTPEHTWARAFDQPESRKLLKKRLKSIFWDHRSPTNTKQLVNMPLLARPRPSQTAPTQAVTSHVPPIRKPISRSPSSIDLTFTLRNGIPLIGCLLTTAFGKEGFRGCQREVIEAALESLSTTIVVNSRQWRVRPCSNGNGQVFMLSTPCSCS